MTGLQGRAVVVTRAPHQAAPLDTLLRHYGAEPLSYPCIDIVPPEDTGHLDNALKATAASQFDWLILTSANTVFALENRLRALKLTLHSTSLKVAAIGPATAREAESRLDLRVDTLPEDYVSEGLVNALEPFTPASGQNPMRILLPQSGLADDALAERLRQRGAQVTVIPAYRTVIGSGGVDLPDWLARRKVDALTFTSGSTVVNCFARLKKESHHRGLLANVTIACIGSKTADVAHDFGLSNCIVPAEHTLQALVAALDAHFSSQETGVPPT